jgi:hypothetical protein
MKIDEPKTPYVHYDHVLDKVIDMDGTADTASERVAVYYVLSLLT